ncbi:hypothetical protein BKM31_21565 [[Actinomadura] parvosata subsp. kistnae]|uniref:Uncharacterized protein n=1 Tax=[Actinomadura] parvosata subsp. kistnae TaxID=1909395 RepID=A0A1V0A0K9_9ACTN|nr:hypothetical protein [Nonomuraea sp. ATCC 55076]AQZ63702.1 hypothetical protein BKM31_21565 [Nonomuraea sp. ATCC 55076]
MSGPAGRARVLHAQLHLLDRQVVHDHDGRLVCKVDDLELAFDDEGRPYVTAILMGPLALGPRVGGVLGRLMAGAARLFGAGGEQAPPRIPMANVSHISSAVHVGGELERPALERWVRRRLIEPIPGARHENE